MQMGHPTGYIALEESVERTARGFMGIHLNKPPHDWDFEESELRHAFSKSVAHGRLFLYDHFGSMACDNLLAKDPGTWSEAWVPRTLSWITCQSWSAVWKAGTKDEKIDKSHDAASVDV